MSRLPNCAVAVTVNVDFNVEAAKTSRVLPRFVAAKAVRVEPNCPTLVTDNDDPKLVAAKTVRVEPKLDDEVTVRVEPN